MQTLVQSQSHLPVPEITNAYDLEDVYHFTLNRVNVSLANAIRRVILSEIPTVVFQTHSQESNQCVITENTSRLHNEILKQRLGCIPIHMKEELFTKEKEDFVLPGKYIMELDVTNDTDNILYVTTEHFKIKNKTTGKYMSENDLRNIFPKNQITQSFIDFARLRPRISDTIPGETLKMTCEFAISEAKVNSMYNVASKCSYANTPDRMKMEEAWESYVQTIADSTTEEISFQKKNFELLDAQKYFTKDSFDFVVQSVGVYDNLEIIKYACIILQHKFIDLIEFIDSDTVVIVQSDSTMEHCYDFVLEDEDYTVGKVLEYILYENYFVHEKQLTFCGFKKMHPHDSDSIIRIAFVESVDKTVVRRYVRAACVEAQDIYKTIYNKFDGK